MAARENCCNSRNTFLGIYGVAQVFGLLAVILLVIWQCVFNGGFNWHGKYAMFAIHPLVMILSMVYLYGNGVVLYRVLDRVSKTKNKYIHLTIMFITLTLATFGIATVFVFHKKMHYKNMYTMHSWCGMITLGFFAGQFLAGFVVFLWPGVKGSLKDIALPIHRFGGFVILALSLASVISGVLDDLLLCITNKEYRELPPHAVFFNVIGLLCMIYILLVMYLIYRDDWKRGGTFTNPPEMAMEEVIEEPRTTTPVPETSGPGELEKLLPNP